jgi:hypothetical protein
VRLPEGRAGALTASRSRFCRAEVRGTATAVPAVLTESRRGGLNCAATERRTALLRFTPKLNVGTGRLGESLLPDSDSLIVPARLSVAKSSNYFT